MTTMWRQAPNLRSQGVLTTTPCSMMALRSSVAGILAAGRDQSREVAIERRHIRPAGRARSSQRRVRSENWLVAPWPSSSRRQLVHPSCFCSENPLSAALKLRMHTLVIAMRAIPLPQLMWTRWANFAYLGELTRRSQLNAHSNR